MWQPVPNEGAWEAMVMASSTARSFAMIVDEVTMPARCASAMARFTPEVIPKSSALMMRRRIGIQCSNRWKREKHFQVSGFEFRPSPSATDGDSIKHV
jgi:hypothetical protein